MNASKTNFLKNVITLITGTTIAQAIPIIISPVLTRLYTPEDIGILSLFTTISIIFGNAANAKYELAIVLPQDDKDAYNLAALSILISFFMSVLLLIALLFYSTKIAKLLNSEELINWLFFVPIVVFFMGIFNTLNYLNIRFGNYSKISKAQIYRSLTVSMVQILLGIKNLGPSGLITGNILSHIPLNIELGNGVINRKNLLTNVHINDVRKLSKQYIKFPKFTLPASFINNTSRYLPNLFIPYFFAPNFLGFYSIINRLLNMPLLLIGNSIAQVFTKIIVQEKNSGGNSKKIFDSTLKKLVLISLPTFLILYFSVEDIFGFIFGENWQIGGYYCKILIPLFFMRFIAIPLSITMEVFSKQIYNLIWQIGLLIANLMIIFLTIILSLSFETYLIYTSFIISTFYLINILMSREFSESG
jgi:O-antigen/teichoic acid export membrane protein